MMFFNVLIEEYINIAVKTSFNEEKEKHRFSSISTLNNQHIINHLVNLPEKACSSFFPFMNA